MEVFMYNSCCLDVYYVQSRGVIGAQASVANVIKSWDGSLYIETNVQVLAGPRRTIRWTNAGQISIGGETLNGGLNWHEVRLLANA
jgi:hypothetical protein